MALPQLPAPVPGDTPVSWTARLVTASTYPQVRHRQCAIGYHEECDDPTGVQCRCPCHSDVPLQVTYLLGTADHTLHTLGHWPSG